MFQFMTVTETLVRNHCIAPRESTRLLSRQQREQSEKKQECLLKLPAAQRFVDRDGLRDRVLPLSGLEVRARRDVPGQRRERGLSTTLYKI
jgi:hypothetical protein